MDDVGWATRYDADMNEFQEEEPTKPEVSESLAEVLESLRAGDLPKERPSVRMKAITQPPEIP